MEQLNSSGTSAQIKVVDRFLSDDEIPPLVSGADVILAPYLRHVGSSGLLYWPAAAGKSVITQDFGLIGRSDGHARFIAGHMGAAYAATLMRNRPSTGQT